MVNFTRPTLCYLHVTLSVFSVAQNRRTARARGADFQVGGLTRTRKREPTRGVRGENLKYYSSEMARNASKKR